MNAACIAVQEVDAERSFPLRLRMTEIFAGGQQPERIHNVRDLLLETAREKQAATGHEPWGKGDGISTKIKNGVAALPGLGALWCAGDGKLIPENP